MLNLKARDRSNACKTFKNTRSQNEATPFCDVMATADYPHSPDLLIICSPKIQIFRERIFQPTWNARRVVVVVARVSTPYSCSWNEWFYSKKIWHGSSGWVEKFIWWPSKRWFFKSILCHCVNNFFTWIESKYHIDLTKNLLLTSWSLKQLVAAHCKIAKFSRPLTISNDERKNR